MFEMRLDLVQGRFHMVAVAFSGEHACRGIGQQGADGARRPCRGNQVCADGAIP
jgi:hypothetical protein